MSREPWTGQIQAALQELAEAYDPSIPETKFVFHPLYRVGVAEKSYENIEKIFGESFMGRLRHYSGNLRKVSWIKTAIERFVARLPSDSIIFFRDDKEGMIIASHERQVVLKIFFAETHKILLEEEITTLKKIQKTEFAPYSAKLLLDGETSNGGRWLVTSFCANTHSIKNKLFHQRYMLANFHKFVLPAMTQFYKSFGPEVISLEKWLLEASPRIANHPSKDALIKLINAIDAEKIKFPKYDVLKSNIHHDLHAGNILLDEKQMIIIDWEGEIRGLTLIDVFDFSRRYMKRHKIAAFFFNLFLKGYFKKPPGLVQKSLEYYRNWMNIHFNAHVPEGAERLTVLIYTLERTLLLHEKRSVNRMSDRDGFEFEVLSLV